MGHIQNKKPFFFSETTKAEIILFFFFCNSDYNLFISFCLLPHQMFLLCYESFSILCNIFFAKKVLKKGHFQLKQLTRAEKCDNFQYGQHCLFPYYLCGGCRQDDQEETFSIHTTEKHSLWLLKWAIPEKKKRGGRGVGQFRAYFFETLSLNF